MLDGDLLRIPLVTALATAASDGSDGSVGAWILVPIGAVVAAVFWWSLRVSLLAKRAPGELARRPGWSFQERDETVLAQFDGWPLTLGSRREVRAVVRGQHRGRAVTTFLFDHRRQRLIGSGEDPSDIFRGIWRTLGRDSHGGRDVRVPILAMRMPAALPGFLVRIQIPVDGLFPGLRSGDIHLGDEHFDDAYLVRAEHPQLALDLLSAANRELLLGFSPYSKGPHRGRSRPLHDDPAEGFTMWTARDHLMVLCNAHLDVAGYDRAFDLMADFLDNVPHWVWDVARGGGLPSLGAAPSVPPTHDPRRSTDPPSTGPLSPSPISEA